MWEGHGGGRAVEEMRMVSCEGFTCEKRSGGAAEGSWWMKGGRDESGSVGEIWFRKKVEELQEGGGPWWRR